MKRFLKKLWEGWKRFAHAFGRVQTVILLSVFYILILCPLGLLFRLFGWDPLRSRPSRARRGTNWRDTTNGEPDLESMRRLS
jgi:hypothetical protein